MDMSNANEDHITEVCASSLRPCHGFPGRCRETCICAMSKSDIACQEDLGRYCGTIDTLSQSFADSSESTGVEGATNEMSCVELVDADKRRIES